MRNCCHLEIYMFGLNFNAFSIKAEIGLWHSLSFDLFFFALKTAAIDILSHICLIASWDLSSLSSTSFLLKQKLYLLTHNILFFIQSFHCKRNFIINTNKYQTTGKNNPFCFENVRFQSSSSYEFRIVASFCSHRGIAAIQSRSK